ncbi:MAG: hypothetical protein WAS21_27995, partial [Geminicoccaceae bacterium]
MAGVCPTTQPQGFVLELEVAPSAILRLCRQVMRQLDPAAGEVATLRAGIQLAALVEAAGCGPVNE